jgi:hypothetical protein
MPQRCTESTKDFFRSLFVQVVESGEFPTRPGLLEVIDDHFVSGRVRTGDSELLWVLRIQLRLCFAKTSRGVSLLVENLSIALYELGPGSNAGYAV